MAANARSPLSPEPSVEPKIGDIQTKETIESIINASRQNVQFFMKNNNTDTTIFGSRAQENRDRYRASKNH